ncbi:MAG: CoA ester lyase [Campylobacterales bacterium]|nr:CoA ester lyase [Campylobacterales bacterium]
MIFQNLEAIEKLSIDEKIAQFGNKRKAKYDRGQYRSNMMLNPLRLKHLNRLDTLEADMITLNLEDAIAPSRKKEALVNIAFFLSHIEHSNSFLVVRTNPLDEGGREEIEFLNDFAFDAIRVSKIRTADEIREALDLLAEDKELHISMETKEAFNNLQSLRIDKRFTTANIGILDLLNSLGLPQSLVQMGNPTIDYILSKFLVDCHSVGLRGTSFMFQEYQNTQMFEAWCEREKMMGFKSKACMGPLQVEIANRVFGVDEAEIKRARHIKAAFEANSEQGEHGFMDEKYGFIDEPIYKDALLVLEAL